MNKILPIFAGLACVLAACEKNVQVDVPRSDSKLVVNAFAEKEKPLIVAIGKTRYILDAQPNSPNGDVVTTARPVLYENNVAIDTLVYDPGFRNYYSPRSRVLRTGASYRLSVGATGFATVETQTAVPSQSTITGISRVPNARVQQSGETLDEVTVRLNDPAAEQNFYLLRFYASSFNSGQEYPIDCVNTSDKDVEAIGYADPADPNSCFDGDRVLVKDANFNGREKALRFYIASNRLQVYTDGAGRKHRPYVRVYRITEDHFRYLKSLGAYESADGNPFAEPVNVYTNVRNGRGLFTAYTAAVDTVR